MSEYNYTQLTKFILSLSKKEAMRLRSAYIGTEHLLLAIVKEGSGNAALILKELGLEFDKLLKTIEKTTSFNRDNIKQINPMYSPKLRKILANAEIEAQRFSHDTVGTEHLLLALSKETEGIGAFILKSYNISQKAIEEKIFQIFELEKDKFSKTKKKKDLMLESYGSNLTKLAAEGKIDPVIGRENEIARIVQILSRRKKNNPILIGEPGVGKTAIAEGFALKIAEGNVPYNLKDRNVYSLDLGSLVAGTKFRGDFEKRFKGILGEILNKNNKIILFIDEIHAIIGTGGAEGSLDASNLLKPLLARGEIQCIGTTTLSEFRKYIEKDGALERRFQPIIVNPPTKEETYEILKGLIPRYEKFHKVKYSDEAIKAVVDYADRYLYDKFQPDKSIDLIDELGAKKRIHRVENSKVFQELQGKLSNAIQKKNEAISHQQFENAAKYRDQQLKLADKLDNFEKTLDIPDDKKQITKEDAAKLIAQITGIDVTEINTDESMKLRNIEKTLAKRIIGQSDAISAISRQIRISRTGLKDKNKPIGTFLFLGPTGVGKTELAKELSRFLFTGDTHLIQFDMSEYMEKYSASRLIGAPPGYIGYGEGGLLTEKVRRKLYSVVLFDEIEKAHPEIFNILLQIMDEGAITDSLGNRVNFANTIIILTSNIGTKEIKSISNFGFSKGKTSEKAIDKELLGEEVKKFFQPEFLNRLSGTVYFNKLSIKDCEEITDIFIHELNVKLSELGIKIIITYPVKKYLVDLGFSENYGARPLKRVINEKIESVISQMIINREIAADDIIKIKKRGGKLIFIKISNYQKANQKEKILVGR